MSSLKKRVAKATFWNILSSLVTGFVRFATTAVLAHLLTPDDFGLVGVAFIVFGLVSIFGNTGLGAALIYKKDIDDSYYSTVFWATVVFSFVLASVTVVCAYPASIFFNAPKLFPLLLTLSLTFIINGLSLIHSIKLQKEMNYKTIGFGVFASTVLSSIIAIILAYKNFGVWCLIIQSILWAIFNSLWLIVNVRWIPKRLFDKQKFFELFQYSRNLLMETILNYFSQKLDYFIIGRKLGTQRLGYYKMAYSVPHIIYDEFTKRITPVLFPLLCKVQDDLAVFKKSYLNTLKFNSMIVFPIMATFIFVARQFILTVYGHQWERIIPTVKILAVCGILRCVNTFSGSVFGSKGRPDIGLKINMIKFPIIAVALFFASRYGVNGIAVVMVVAELLTIIVVQPIVARFFEKFFIKDILLSLFPAVVVALSTWGILYTGSFFITIDSVCLELLVCTSFATIIIIAQYYLFFRSDLKEIMAFAMHIFKK